jgi:hypothetical protein
MPPKKKKKERKEYDEDNYKHIIKENKSEKNKQPNKTNSSLKL